MKSFKVVAAVHNSTTQQMEVVKEITNDDNSIEYNLQTFHVETLEHYAALYDVDDIDTVIDMIVHEPFVGDVEPLKVTKEAARSLFQSRLEAVKVNGGKLGKVTAATKSRMSDKGIHQKYLDAVDVDPYEVIKSRAPFNKEVIALRKEYYQTKREAQAKRKPQRPVEALNRSTVDRIAEAKRLLQGPHREEAVQGKQNAQRPTKQAEPKHVTVSLRKGQPPRHA